MQHARRRCVLDRGLAEQRFGLPAASTPSPFAALWLAAPSSGTDLTTYTFSGVNFGVASADRLIVVVTAIGSASNRTVASATIGGVAATLNMNTSGRVHIFSAVVPTGTSGDVVITFSGVCGRCGIGVYSLKNYISATPVDTGNSGLAAGVATQTATLDVPAGGAAIAGMFVSVATTVQSWAGGMQAFEGAVGGETNTFSGASKTSATALTNHNMTCTVNNAGSMQVAAASWG